MQTTEKQTTDMLFAYIFNNKFEFVAKLHFTLAGKPRREGFLESSFQSHHTLKAFLKI